MRTKTCNRCFAAFLKKITDRQKLVRPEIKIEIVNASDQSCPSVPHQKGLLQVEIRKTNIYLYYYKVYGGNNFV